MKTLIAVSLAALAIAMCAGHGVLTKPILADDQIQFFLNERCASGEPPHVSHWEVKTQLSTLIGGAAIALGRRAGLLDVHSGRVASVAAAAAATVLAWLLALELTRNGAAALVAGAATLSIYGLYLEAAIGFQPKVFMVAFLLAAHLAAAKRRALLAGITGACAFLCWQPAALVLASIGFAALLDRRATWTFVWKVVAGALVVLLVYEAWFAWNGALGPQIHQEFVIASHAPHKPVQWGKSIWFVLTESRGFLPRPSGLPSVFVVATIVLWLALLWSPRRAWSTMRDEPGLVAFWIAAHLAVLFTLYDHQAHPDMLLPQAYFAVACGVAFGWLGTALARVRAGAWIAAVAAAVCVALGLWDARMDVVHAARGRTGLDAQLALGRLTDLYFDHRGSVWALGPLHLLALNHRSNWTPIGNVGHETSELDMKTYRPLRDGRMPEIVLSSRGLRPMFTTTPEYLDITPAAFAAARIRVYSRRSTDQPGFDPSTAPKPVRNPR